MAPRNGDRCANSIRTACATCRARKVTPHFFLRNSVGFLVSRIRQSKLYENTSALSWWSNYRRCGLRIPGNQQSRVHRADDLQVKCDERPNGCVNCERLQLDCVQNGGVSAAAKRPSTSYEPVVGIKRKRTFRSCIPCRDSKVKCSGERSNCTRCQQRRTSCVYDAEQVEPAWVQSIATPASETHTDSMMIPPHTPQDSRAPSRGYGPLSNSEPVVPGCPPGLLWYA